jgi:Protein of unknown function (DUF2934)
MICVHMLPEAVLRDHHGLIDARTRHDMIACAAYALALQRGLAPGHELDDWLAAEQKIDAAVAWGAPPALL